MRILVTGGTGVVGESTLLALLRKGHQLRVLSRKPERVAAEWPERVETIPGDVTEPDTLRKAAEGCDAVLHMAGIVTEQPPHLTFRRVNVEGTANVIAEAIRSRARRLVYISSLGADRGASDYHRSKLEAEKLVRTFKGQWLILRPGNVYGPGDEVISLLLKLVRSLPAIPVIGNDEMEFQPIWHEDLGEAIAVAVERENLTGEALDLSGPERTTMRDLVDRLCAVTARNPVLIPLSTGLASLSLRAVNALGISVPLDPGQVTMLEEGNVVQGRNALLDEFGVAPTSLDNGLRKLADALPENLPSDGVGPLREKRFWADIQGSSYSREELFKRFRDSFGDIMPIDVGVEPGSPSELREGATPTMKLPMRGTVQVRVQEIDQSSVTVATLEGHPIAGTVRFSFDQVSPDVIRFEVHVLDRSGNFFDLFAMESLGRFLQDGNWIRVVQRVVDDSGGRALKGAEHDAERLDGDAAEAVERWADDVVADRKRKEREEQTEN